MFLLVYFEMGSCIIDGMINHRTELTFFLILTGIVLVLLYFIFQPYLAAIFFALVFYIVFEPVYRFFFSVIFFLKMHLICMADYKTGKLNRALFRALLLHLRRLLLVTFLRRQL